MKENDIFEFTGKQSGKTSVVLVGVHGDEPCGVEALQSILPSISILSGKVTFIIANPPALKENKRFLKANLNRMFLDPDNISKADKESYEYKRAQFIKTYLDKADSLLDIHASFTPESRPFVICEKNASAIVPFLPVDLVVSGFDNVEPGGTDYYMNSIGKIGICLECGYLGDPVATNIARLGILSYLQSQGHIDNVTIEQRNQNFIRMTSLYKTKTSSFQLAKQFTDFEHIATESLIGTDGDNEVRAIKDSIILFARNPEGIDEEAFLLGEKTNSLT